MLVLQHLLFKVLKNPTRFTLYTFNEDHHLEIGEQLPTVYNQHTVIENFQF